MKQNNKKKSSFLDSKALAGLFLHQLLKKIPVWTFRSYLIYLAGLTHN